MNFKIFVQQGINNDKNLLPITILNGMLNSYESFNFKYKFEKTFSFYILQGWINYLTTYKSEYISYRLTVLGENV